MIAASDRDASDKENDLPSKTPLKDDEIVRAKKEKWARYMQVLRTLIVIAVSSSIVVSKMN